jgi:hypothetical protein
MGTLWAEDDILRKMSKDSRAYPLGGKEGLEEYSQGNHIRIYMDDTASYIYYMPLTGNSRN